MKELELVQRIDLRTGTVQGKLVERRPTPAQKGIKPPQMVLMLVRANRDIGQREGVPRKGCHWVRDGARAAFRELYPGVDDRAVTDELIRVGKLFRHMDSSGPTFYLPEDWGKR